MTKKTSKFFLDRTTDAIIGGVSIGVINASPLPNSIKGGTTALIGVKMLKNTARGL